VPDVFARLTEALADRYALDRELGEGGMATVYLAEDLRHRRKVAIKVLRPELAAVIGAERFLKEIETTASRQHPHILPLLDSGQAGEGPGMPGRRFRARHRRRLARRTAAARNRQQYDVAPGDRRFLMVREPSDAGPGTVVYVENWLAELKAKVSGAVK
jgi:serine/threonine protein kinase